MREIKFRMWDNIQNSFYEDGFSIDMDGHQWHDDNDESHPLKERYILSQFTGLKDKSGVDIYEGDIVKVDNYNMYPKKSKVIQWDNDLSSYVFKSDSVTPVRLPMAIGITVIGNIHQNLELS